MKTIKDEGLVNKLHVLDGTNYDYWKTMMVTFLKFMDNKAWKYMIKWWTQPVVTFEYGTTSLKPQAQYTNVEDNEALGNSNVPYLMAWTRTCSG